VDDLLGEDLLDVKQILERLMIDPILLCDVVYCVCKPQADAQGITDEEFARAMAGDAIAQAKRALMEDLVDFFPDPKDRENLKAAIGKFDHLAERAKGLIRTKLDSPELSREIEAALSAVGGSFGSSPGSSGPSPEG